MIKPVPLLLMAFGLTAACENALPTAEPDQVQTRATAPPGAAPGSCWGKNVSPAVVETVTEQILVQPAEIMVDGSVTRPAVYKTETRQAIVQERVETWFETPCAAALTPEFVATLQRALKARGFYRGQISGRMDTRTRAAVRQYQAPQGLDSGILSLAAARKLGLIAVKREQ
ncbi:peptidoglycan-binding domain-containing protein [uncultured Roseovarius sp.]|uniref:peptidoglycan-binding domain-containing protein n=1 Tax=uncultured Roseovarius sp. TaxID=293344 RepID=UPI00260A68A3|nr:peptidoglycan-binding domain-containing protein [uncultured Roseovarius sp.]